jgi:ankyrin repeat protein
LPIHRHLSTDNEPLLKLVMRYQPDVLRKMFFNGAPSADYARWLISQGLDPGRRNWLEMTPLHRFALQGNVDMASVCLEFGAPLDAIDDEFSSTPLGWAARAGQKAMVQWLLDKGANPALPQDKPWARPHHWAQRRGQHEIAALLPP